MNRRGLSLLEVLIALSLGIVLLGSVTTFAWSQLNSRDRILDAAHARRSLTLVIDRLEQDLISVIAGTSDGMPGLQGDRNSIMIHARGLAPRWSDDPSSMIGDLHRLSIGFDGASGRIEMIRTPYQLGSELVEEDPAALPGVIRDLQFRFFDGRQWVDQWNSLDRGQLPLAVEIAAWHGQPDVDVEVDEFDSAFGLRSSEDLQSDLDTVISELDSIPDRRRVILIPDAEAADELEDDLRVDGVPAS
ncbi:MAG: hypothetical protein CMJ39_01370 [Phycisphaerae bacterium]|nr:hypothetical protein [Phycisphaerae bacterium]|tara:strand:+ start:1703 stop:2440 length:738 start_codon:yes stop_codon:yes gene_type:complete